MAASQTSSVAFDLLRANVLHVYPLVKVVGLVRLLDTQSRGIHPLDQPLAIGVRQFATAFGPRRASRPERQLLPNERHGTGAGLKAACRREGSPNFPLWASLLKSPASDVRPSWAHQLRINNGKLAHIERRAAHLLLTWTFLNEKWWQPPSTGRLNRSFATMPSRAPSGHFLAGTMIEFVVTSPLNVSLLSRSAQ